MKQVQVRCWEMFAGREKVLIAYPENKQGYALGICLNCGLVYAIDVLSSIYLSPLSEKLKGLGCDRCHVDLSLHWAEYPETYLTSAATVASFQRPREIPDDSLSLVRSFPSIY